MSIFPRFIQPLFILINLLSYQVFLPLLISFLFLCVYQSSFFCVYDFQFPFLDLCVLIVSVLAKYNLFYYSSNCPKNDLFCFKRKNKNLYYFLVMLFLYFFKHLFFFFLKEVLLCMVLVRTIKKNK